MIMGKNIHKFALQPDEITRCNSGDLSFSERMEKIISSAGHEVKLVDLFKKDPVKQINGCQGFIWRFFHVPQSRLSAKRIIFAIEQGMKIPVFPNWNTAWHYDDKIAQIYLLDSVGIPTPKTKILLRQDDALKYCDTIAYPFIFKLATGASAQNVILIKNRREAACWINKMFGSGLFHLNLPKKNVTSLLKRVKPSIKYFLNESQPDPGAWFDLQKNYFYIQEFLSNNHYDTRVTIIGNRAFAFRRFNRPDDFRASGSGNIDWNPEKIDLSFIQIGFEIKNLLNAQSIAIDGLYKNNQPVIAEISYTYASWAVHECPGHWVMNEEDDTLTWIENKMWPEEAIFEDLIFELNNKKPCG